MAEGQSTGMDTFTVELVPASTTSAQAEPVHAPGAQDAVPTPNADRIARHDRLRKKVLPVNLRHEDWASLFSCLFANARRFV